MLATVVIRVAWLRCEWLKGCFVEASLSALLKPRELRLDLSKVAHGSAKWASVLNGIGGKGCVAGRAPPQTPDAVRALLHESKKFTSKADATTVADLYESFFAVAAPALMTLAQL